jgi:hypothetical protein
VGRSESTGAGRGGVVIRVRVSGAVNVTVMQDLLIWHELEETHAAS